MARRLPIFARCPPCRNPCTTSNTRTTPTSRRLSRGRSTSLTARVSSITCASSCSSSPPPVATGGPPRQVTDFDRSIGSGVMSDTGSNERGQPAWVGDDLYFLAAINGTGQVWRVAASGGTPTQVTEGAHAIAGWDITRDGSLL